MMRRQYGFLRTTALGGLLFLLPLIVVGALVASIVPMAISTATVLAEWLPISTPATVALLVAITIGVLLAACFLAGLAARASLGRRFSTWAERNLQLLFPRYAIIREQMAGNVGGDEHRPRLLPVLVACPEGRRLAFESDRADEVVAVYLPGSPDTWSGYVVYVEADRVERIALDLPTAIAICEGLGRESVGLVEPSGDAAPG